MLDDGFERAPLGMEDVKLREAVCYRASLAVKGEPGKDPEGMDHQCFLKDEKGSF